LNRETLAGTGCFGDKTSQTTRFAALKTGGVPDCPTVATVLAKSCSYLNLFKKRVSTTEKFLPQTTTSLSSMSGLLTQTLKNFLNFQAARSPTIVLGIPKALYTKTVIYL